MWMKMNPTFWEGCKKVNSIVSKQWLAHESAVCLETLKSQIWSRNVWIPVIWPFWFKLPSSWFVWFHIFVPILKFPKFCDSQITNSAFLKFCISQILQFSNPAFLKFCDSQIQQFSNSAILGRHHQLDNSLAG